MSVSRPPQLQHTILADLFDMRFRYLLTPRLVGCLYGVVMAFIGSGVLAALLFLWSLSTWAGSGWWWLAPVIVTGGLAMLMVTRIVLEWVLMTYHRSRMNR